MERAKTSVFLSERESLEMFIEGCKRAASKARELAQNELNPTWATVAALMEQMVSHGRMIATEKAMSRQKTLRMLDLMVKK